MDETQLDALVRKMTQEQQDHLRTVIASIIYCYVNTQARGVVLLDQGDKTLQIMTINADDIDLAELVHSAMQYLTLAAAPTTVPKEKWN